MPIASPDADLVVVANPRNRRCQLFRDAATAAGLDVAVWPWLGLLAGDLPPVATARWLRIDAPGEDAAVHAHLVGPDADLCDVGPLARWYDGFLAGVDRAVAALAGSVCLNPPGDLRVLFDKAVCHAHLAVSGIPVPPALGTVGSWAELRDRMDQARWRRVFVKPRHGSSASGVVALTAARGRVEAVTSAVLEGDPPRLRNRLGLRPITDPAQVATLIDLLAADGIHVERWYPKLSVGGHVVDLRVVVTAGEPTHVVVRAASGPITNLHLGNRRGDLDTVIAAIGPQRWEDALDTCRAVATVFPGSLHLGVDLLVSADGRGHVVAEINAFGDLLPGITNRGRSTHAEQVDALISGRHPRSAPVARPTVVGAAR